MKEKLVLKTFEEMYKSSYKYSLWLLGSKFYWASKEDVEDLCQQMWTEEYARHAEEEEAKYIDVKRMVKNMFAYICRGQSKKHKYYENNLFKPSLELPDNYAKNVSSSPEAYISLWEELSANPPGFASSKNQSRAGRRYSEEIIDKVAQLRKRGFSAKETAEELGLNARQVKRITQRYIEETGDKSVYKNDYASLSEEDKLVRSKEILELRSQGWKHKEIAAKYGYMETSMTKVIRNAKKRVEETQ